MFSTEECIADSRITRLKEITFMESLKQYLSKWFSMRRGMHVSQMWGRIFNLNEKELVNLDGFDLYVMSNDYIGVSIIRNKNYEPHVTNLIKNILSQDDVFVDVGANVGYFTMLASSILKGRGKVIAFEPNPQNLQLIYSSLLHNGYSKVEIYPYAVSNSAGILRFTTVGSNGGR